MRHLACILALATVAMCTAADTRHPLTKAIDYDAHLLVVLDLHPNRNQLFDILTAARAARQLVSAYETEEKQAATANADMFKQQAKALAEGTPLDEQATAAIKAYHEARQRSHAKLLAGVDAQISAVRRRLARDQVRLVDWTRPAEVSVTSDDQAVLEELRQLLYDVNQTERLLERIRYLAPHDYAITRTGRLEEFLREYVRPGTADFKQAMDFMFQLTDETRLVKEDDWPQQAPLFAGRVLQYLGALEPEQRPQAQAAYNWWDVHDLLTDEQTPKMLEQMLAAGGNPAQ